MMDTHSGRAPAGQALAASGQASVPCLDPPGFDPSRKDFTIADGTLNTVADKLDDARALIERRGWVQCAFDSPDGVCILGALNRTPGVGYCEPLGEIAQNLLKEVAGTETLMFWNDAVGRTKEDVLGALREAAALARSRALPTAWAQINAYMADIELASA